MAIGKAVFAYNVLMLGSVGLAGAGFQIAQGFGVSAEQINLMGVAVVALAAGFSLLVVGMGIRAMRRRPLTGSEGMVGLVGVAKTNLAPQGKILVRGELWDAISEQPLQPGDHAEVTRIDGLKLYVKPAPPKGDA